MRILFVVPYAPSRIRVRPYELIRGLRRRGHEVTVGTLWTRPEERDGLRELGGRVVARRLGGLRALGNVAAAVFGRAPFQSAVCWHGGLARALRGELAGHDVLHVEHLRGARYGRWLKERGAPPVVWDSVDCISRLLDVAAARSRSLRGRLLARLDGARTRRSEPALSRAFDRTVATSAAERDALLALGAERVRVVGNGVDTDYFAPGGARDDATIVFTGKMSYHANVTAALHLIRDVLPRVLQERPDARVCLVGHAPPRAVRRLAGERVEVTGSVPDLRPWLRRATVAVAPLPYAVGVQNKILEAMACGAPVVASPVAAAALEARAGRDLVVAEDAAAALVALLADPARRRRVGEAGRAYVERRHDWDRAAAELEAVYREARAERA